MSGVVDGVRGMRDVLPDEQQKLQQVQATISTTFQRHGYQPLDLPLVEYRDLYRRKLGEELVGKLYEFEMGGRTLALRPEWTASVLRAYVNQLQEQPLPLRLCYSGPVFRYERPQRQTYRQFTQLGIELIGGPTPRAEAEVLALACAGLEAAGLQDYYVQLGHLGLVRHILQRLGLAERTQGLLIWNIDRMRSGGSAALREQLIHINDELPIDPALLADLNDEQAAELFQRVIEEMQINLSFGTRSPKEIVDRLVRKLRREDQQPRIKQALALLEPLSQIRSHPPEALAQATELLLANDLPADTLNELRTVLDLLGAHGLDSRRLVLDFGLGRGLHYYTGLIFEIYDRTDNQLCGGGRYDDLVTALGGSKSVPAIGFAYGLERVVAALPAHLAVSQSDSVLVIAIDEADYPYALDVAQRLRSVGYTATVDIRQRSLSSNLRDATKRGLHFIAIVGESERRDNVIGWRNLETREEQRVALTELNTLTKLVS